MEKRLFVDVTVVGSNPYLNLEQLGQFLHSTRRTSVLRSATQQQRLESGRWSVLTHPSAYTA